jgi:hypothetical protein
MITIRRDDYSPMDISAFDTITTKVTRYIDNGIEFAMPATILNPTIGLIRLDMLSTETEKMIFDRYWFHIAISNIDESVKVAEGQILMITF